MKVSDTKIGLLLCGISKIAGEFPHLYICTLDYGYTEAAQASFPAMEVSEKLIHPFGVGCGGKGASLGSRVL